MWKCVNIIHSVYMKLTWMVITDMMCENVRTPFIHLHWVDMNGTYCYNMWKCANIIHSVYMELIWMVITGMMCENVQT